MTETPVRIIVCAIDGKARSSAALATAEELGARFGAGVVAVHAGGRFSEEELERLDQVRSRAPRGRELVEVVDEGPVRAVLDVVRSRPGSIVCMATRARRGLRRTVLGSVAEELTAGCGVPVVLVGPRSRQGPGTGSGGLVVCLDGSSSSEATLPTAASWAEEYGMSLRLVSVVRAENRVLLENGYLEQVAASLTPVAEVELLRGAPVRALTGYLRRLTHPLVMMSVRGSRGLEHLAVGSVTAGVVARSPHPVVVLEPRSAP